MMRTMCICFHFFLISIISYAQKEIKEEEVDRIVKSLSADEMEGRKIFTTGIEKASDFIINEFQKIGLEPLKGSENLEQEFSVFSSEIRKSEIRINNRNIEETKYFVQSDQPEIIWNSPEDLEFVQIKKEDDFRKRYSAISSSEGNQIIFVDSVHADLFSRYQDNYSRPKIIIESTENESSKIFLLGISESVNSIEVHVLFTRDEKTLKNIVGLIPGKSRKNEYIIFSAHYDHLGYLPQIEGDSIANGADDNASGTAAVISLARYFKNQPKPERSLIFLAFTAEEIGLYGSSYFSKQMEPQSIVAMINMEMIGTASKFGPNTAFLTGYELSDLGQILKNNLRQSEFAIHPDPYPKFNLFYRSDNATMARMGVPAHTVSSSQIDQDSNYHTVNDEFENLDISHLTNIIRGIATSVKGIVDGKDTPSRIDTTSIK